MFGFYSKEKLTNIGVSNQEDFGQTFPTPRETTATTTTTENLQPAVVVVKKAVPKNRSNKKRQPLGKSQLQLLVLFQIIRYCFYSDWNFSSIFLSLLTSFKNDKSRVQLAFNPLLKAK